MLTYYKRNNLGRVSCLRTTCITSASVFPVAVVNMAAAQCRFAVTEQEISLMVREQIHPDACRRLAL